MESEEPLRSTTGPKGWKYIARGEAPGPWNNITALKGRQKRMLNMALTLIFPGIYHCFGPENKMPCRPFGACILLLSLQGVSPPAISCRPFRPNFEIPNIKLDLSTTYSSSHARTRAPCPYFEIPIQSSYHCGTFKRTETSQCPITQRI